MIARVTQKEEVSPLASGRPLKGVRILDFSWFNAAPYGTMLLGFLGAEVLRVETRRHPDNMRRTGYREGVSELEMSASVTFSDNNLGKMGITLDMGNPKAVDIAKRIAAVSDVVVENFTSGIMERWGMDYWSLKKINPRIIMLSLSAMGRKGPESSLPGFAAIFTAVSGLGYLTGYSDGPPMEMRLTMDINSGAMAAFAVIAALHARRATGKGQDIDLAAVEVASGFIGETLLDYSVNGRSQMRQGNDQMSMAPHGAYPCQGNDKWVTIAVGTDEEWRCLVNAMGNPSWAMEARFKDGYSRWLHRRELDELMSRWTRNQTNYQVTERLQAAGVAAVNTMDMTDVHTDRHLKERGVFIEVDHSAIGRHRTMAPPWVISGARPPVSRGGPLIGEHTNRVLSEILQMSQEEIAQLEEEGVLY